MEETKLGVISNMGSKKVAIKRIIANIEKTQK